MNIYLSRWATAGTILAMTTLGLAAPTKSPLFQSKQGYTISPPIGFQKSPLPIPIDVMFVNSKGASLNVMVSDLPPHTTLETLRASALKTLPRFMNKFKVLSQGNIRIGGDKALTIAASVESATPPAALRLLSPPTLIHFLQVITIHNGKKYVFNCGSRASLFALYEPDFKKSLASVHWIK